MKFSYQAINKNSLDLFKYYFFFDKEIIISTFLYIIL
jgi:hypothetical protein